MPLPTTTPLFEDERPVARTYVKKADRGFAPAGSGYQPSQYRLAEQLYEHYARCRNDREYGGRYTAYLLETRLTAVREEQQVAASRRSRNGVAQRVRASEVKNCERQLTFRLLDFEAAPTGVGHPEWNLAALSGTGLHSEIEVALSYLGLSERSEYAVTSEDGSFSGRVDHRLAGPPAAILDVKTVSQKDFDERCWGRKISGYTAQVSAYALLERVSIGVVLLVNRNTGELFDYQWEVDTEYAQSVLARARRVVEKVQNRQLGYPETWSGADGGYYCQNLCPYFTHCEVERRTGSIQSALDEKGA